MHVSDEDIIIFIMNFLTIFRDLIPSDFTKFCLLVFSSSDYIMTANSQFSSHLRNIRLFVSELKFTLKDFKMNQNLY